MSSLLASGQSRQIAANTILLISLLAAAANGQSSKPLTRELALQLLQKHSVPRGVDLQLEVCCVGYAESVQDDPRPPDLTALQKLGFIVDRRMVHQFEATYNKSRIGKLWSWIPAPFGRGVPARVEYGQQRAGGRDTSLNLLLWERGVVKEITGMKSEGKMAQVEYYSVTRKAGLYDAVAPALADACSRYNMTGSEVYDTRACRQFIELEAECSAKPVRQYAFLALWDDGWRIERAGIQF